MSGKRVWNMKELSQKLERLIETAVEKEEIAGANIVVIRDGQEMAFAAGGYADIEAGKKYERDTIARLYSMTKPVTSAAVSYTHLDVYKRQVSYRA